jgi:hypothetical protein
MQGDLKALTDAIVAIGSISTWQIVGVVTAAGTIAMAMLQLVKDLTPLRREFQRWWLQGWIAAHVDAFNRHRQSKAADKKALPAVSAGTAETLLIELATGGDDRAFYELAVEQMVAQMNAAVQIMLDYPKKYCDLLVVLSEGADLNDVSAVISQSPEAKARKTAPSAEYLEARTRVSHRVQRNLDAVQIALGSRWRFWMQTTAIVLSVLLLELGVILFGGARLGALLLAIPIGILGGYLAPVARDVVATLQTLRK